MTTPFRQAPSAPVVPISGRPPTEPIITPGMIGPNMLATPEEVAEQEAAERERTDRANHQLDAALAAAWACGCCGAANAAAFSPDGLCPDCRSVVFALRAEQRGSETVNGRSRRELAADYLTRQT